MDARDAAQAFELVRALREQVHEMTTQLDRLQRQSLTSSISRAATLRSEIAALRRDINEAQMFISRLRRRYLPDNGDRHATRPERPQAR
jgi:regulator of replication initiation timing